MSLIIYSLNATLKYNFVHYRLVLFYSFQKMKAQFVITVLLVALIALTSQAAADEGKLTFIQHLHIYSISLFYSVLFVYNTSN